MMVAVAMAAQAQYSVKGLWRRAAILASCAWLLVSVIRARLMRDIAALVTDTFDEAT